MQYTGLKDKNGKEVYEGDILRFNNHGYRNGQVVWNADECCYELQYPAEPYQGQTESYLHRVNTYEVIGNIYENLNLLKG